MQRLQNPLPIFLDQRGSLLDAGRVYIGRVRQDPEVSPASVYWDAALTVPATQPLRTRGGVIVNNGAPAAVFIDGNDYSVRTRDADGNLVNYVPSVTDLSGGGGDDSGPAYQPLADSLTAISALETTDYGLALLEVANQAALRAIVGYVAGLPLTGGTVSGNIMRKDAGPHLYHVDGTFTAGRVYVTAEGAADPTSAPGDIWLTY